MVPRKLPQPHKEKNQGLPFKQRDGIGLQSNSIPTVRHQTGLLVENTSTSLQPPPQSDAKTDRFYQAPEKKMSKAHTHFI
ncbi:MAG: hypothetical protein ACQCN6_03995 [Candidatus Bathyarchaeia archaeon]